MTHPPVGDLLPYKMRWFMIDFGGVCADTLGAWGGVVVGRDLAGGGAGSTRRSGGAGRAARRSGVAGADCAAVGARSVGHGGAFADRGPADDPDGHPRAVDGDQASLRLGVRDADAGGVGLLHLRRFCRLGLSERVPDESTVRKLTRRLGAEVAHELTRTVIQKARREKRFRPRAARIDSTVVEADVRYPTDAGLEGGRRARGRSDRTEPVATDRGGLVAAEAEHAAAARRSRSVINCSWSCS